MCLVFCGTTSLIHNFRFVDELREHLNLYQQTHTHGKGGDVSGWWIAVALGFNMSPFSFLYQLDRKPPVSDLHRLPSEACPALWNPAGVGPPATPALTHHLEETTITSCSVVFTITADARL